jgi:hypothetical protein
LVSDGLPEHAHGLHEATLATSYRIFGDVRPSAEIIDLLEASLQNTGLQPPAARAIMSRRG